MTIAKSDDGVTITCEAHVKVKVALIRIVDYDFTAIEEWKDGKVQSLRIRCDDDGKGLRSFNRGRRRRPDREGQRSREVGPRRRLPDRLVACPTRHDGDLPTLEDNARRLTARFSRSAAMTVCGDSINVTRAYRLTSGVAGQSGATGRSR